MNGIAHGLGSSAAEMHACINKVQQWFNEGGRAAGMVVSTHEKAAGRKRGVSNAGITRLPLEEFAKEVRNFLISPNVRIEFSFQAVTRSDKPAIRRRPASTRGRLLRKTHPREPVSAAACLLHEASLLLDPRVQVADIDAIIRAVNQNPEFREELLEDEIVHALTD
jgi:hypothetical protein